MLCWIQGEKPYMCTICGKQFHRSDYLKLHSYSHTDERPFVCNLCGKGFKTNYNLKIHLKQHESNDLLVQSDLDIYNEIADETSFNLQDHLQENIEMNNVSNTFQTHLDDNLQVSNKSTITGLADESDILNSHVISSFLCENKSERHGTKLINATISTNEIKRYLKIRKK